jgi:subtilisin-like proprotein convertase family protein
MQKPVSPQRASFPLSLVLCAALYFGAGLAPAAAFILNGTVNDPTLDTGDDTQSTTTVADLGGGKLVAAWIDSLAGLHIGYGYSSDNGQTWTDAGRVGLGDSAVHPVLAHHKASGAVYLAAVRLSQSTSIKVYKSSDDGHIFSAGVDTTGSGNHSRPWLTVDTFAGAGDGNVYLCWTNSGDGIRFARSTDGGASFGPALGRPISAGGAFCFVLVGTSHQVYVFYYRGTGPLGLGGNNRLYVRRSDDQGVTFAAERVVANPITTSVHGDLGLNGSFDASSYPHAAVDPVTGRLYVVYNDDPDLDDPSDNGDIFLVHANANGNSWSDPVRVNDDADRDQFSPTIAFSPTGGRAMISYYSRSHDTDNHMFHRRGRLGQAKGSGAIQFNRSFQMGPDTPVIVGQDQAVGLATSRYMGVYDQIAAGNNTFSATWSDSRLGNTEHARQPDVRFARIDAAPSAAGISLSLVEVFNDPIALGEAAIIRVRVSATGGIATDVFLSMAPIFGLTPVAAAVGGNFAPCNTIMGFVGCRLNNIADGAHKVVNIVVVGVHKSGTRDARITATTSSNDPTASNNTLVATVTVNPNPAVQQQVFSTGNISTPIPEDGTALEVELDDIAEEGILTHMIAGIRISHPNAEDLDIFLVAPNGDKIALATGQAVSGYGSGATSCAGKLTQFADYRREVPPIAVEKGIVKPEQRIGTLLGAQITGIWKLRIIDRVAQGDTGIVHCFRLRTFRVEE